MTALTFPHIAAQLAGELQRRLDWQVTDSSRPDDGAYISDATGIAAQRETSEIVTGCVYLYAARRRQPGLAGPDDARLLARANRAMDYLLRSRRTNGLIDLHGCNYASGPDTGFVQQHLCTALELVRALRSGDPTLAQLAAKLEDFVQAAAHGMLQSGFHTPNHRWVIASALAQTRALFPEFAAAADPVIASYVAEGIDINADSVFIERSPVVYDSVNDRSLLLLASLLPWEEALDAVAHNLRFNLHLLHGDASIETGLSHRYDYRSHFVPAALVHNYLWCHLLRPDPQFAAAAAYLWARAGEPSFSALLWVAYALLKFGEPTLADVALPDDFSRWYDAVGLWRVRRGPLSVSAFRDAYWLINARFGQAELAAVSIHQSYFGPAGEFIAETADWGDDALVLHSSGNRHPRRPGYELPLDRPVPPEAWDRMLEERAQVRHPFAATDLTIREVADGFDLHVKSLGGMTGVTAQIALDFPAGGIWQTAGCALQPVADQTLFLREGYGAMRYGLDQITIGPGADAHQTWHLRDARPNPGLVRVLIPLLTPLDHAFSIRFRHGVPEP